MYYFVRSNIFTVHISNLIGKLFYNNFCILFNKCAHSILFILNIFFWKLYHHDWDFLIPKQTQIFCFSNSKISNENTIVLYTFSISVSVSVCQHTHTHTYTMSLVMAIDWWFIAWIPNWTFAGTFGGHILPTWYQSTREWKSE